MATSFFAGVSLGVSSGILSAGQSVQNLASKIGNVTDGYSAANAAFAGMKAYDALSSLSDGLNAGNLASISLTAGFTYSKTETSLTTSTPVVPTISASSVDISTNGDFVSRGLQISAVASSDHADDPDNGSVLISANNIDMGGAWASSEASSSSKSAGASIGVSVGVGAGSVTGITPTGSVSAGQSKSSSTTTTPVVSVVSASNGITFTSKGNTTLDNTIFSAGTIIGTVGGDLSIVSTPGTGSQSNSSQSLGFSFTGPTVGKSDDGSPLLTTDNAKTALGGLTLGGVQPGFGKGSGSTSWIDQPSGLYSTGDQTITVGGNTNLAASGLISSDGQVNLDTGTLTWSDFVGTQKYQGYQVDANIDLYSGKDANGKTQNNSSAEGKYQLDDVEQSVKATISGSGAPGNITIRNTDQQAALEQSGTTRPVDQINTDPANQNVITKDKHIDLEPYVSVQSVTAALDAGKTIAQVLGDAFTKMATDGKVSPADATAAQAILRNVTDPEVLKGLAQCRQGAGSCVIEGRTEIDSTMTGTVEITITPSLADQILNAIATGVAVGKRITGAGGAVGVLFAALFYPNSAGGYELRQKVDINAPGVPGATAELTGNSDGLGRVLTITNSNGGQTKFMLLPTGNSNQYQLIFAADASSNPIAADQLARYAAYLSAYTTVNVVYNQQSGSAGNGGDGRPLDKNNNGGPLFDDDGVSINQPNGSDNNGGGPQVVVPLPNNGKPENNDTSVQDVVTIDSGKWDYFFGRVDSNQHNQDRSLQIQQQFARIGIYDNLAGRSTIAEALQNSVNTPNSVIETFSQTTPNGSVQNFEVVEGLLMGPGGGLKLTSTFEIMPNGAKRLVTTIPKGGR